jgi:hypothetical protein
LTGIDRRTAINSMPLRPLRPSVRDNEVGSLKHEVGSVVDIDRHTAINSMPLRPLRPSVRAKKSLGKSTEIPRSGCEHPAWNDAGREAPSACSVRDKKDYLLIPYGKSK